MSPVREPVTVQQDQIRIRHIGPKAAVWSDAPTSVPEHAVLARTDMVGRPLPVSNVPGSPDFVSGYWTGRLDDAGELQLVFPNDVSGDGVPWKSRFDVTGHLQWLEVYYNGELDSVCCVDQNTPDEASVTVHGDDGFYVLKKAYVRDWIVTGAPRDVIERGTQVWVPVIADNFPPPALNPNWTVTTTNGATVDLGPSGGLYINPNPSAASSGSVTQAVNLDVTDSVWSATCTIQVAELTANSSSELKIVETSDNYGILLYNGTAQLEIDGSLVYQVTVPSATSYVLSLESDGEWVWGFVNGQVVGAIRRNHPTTSLVEAVISAQTNAAVDASIQCSAVLVTALQPFLMAGTDKGDYVLPGDATTYPSGGLSARYFNDLDLQSDAWRIYKVLNPARTQAYGSSSPAEYADQQDPGIVTQNPPAGAQDTNWSCVWFGAIWLPLASHPGTYTFDVFVPSATECAVRLWIGKTRFGDQLIDEWTWSNGATAFTGTLTSISLAGTLPYGAGMVARDGWYPIKMEYAVDATALSAPAFHISTPATYTDPGGTTITGSTSTSVPSTSLSPLGCVDQRYQGISHFDLVQQTLQAFGYHASVEPQQLESGLFPGVLAPRVREGHDTDVVLSADRNPRTDGEGILNYSETDDATDMATSLRGNGAGVQSASGGQLQALVFNETALASALFDLQQWQDFSDASLAPLLQALLFAQLSEQSSPWQSLSADPTGRPRKAFTWPLPGSVQNMRWRPGDGLFIREPQINVWDTSPRQMLVVTRNISPYGIQSTQATFANRPRNPARSLKRGLFANSRIQRNYQRQRVAISGTYVVNSVIAAGATDSNLSILALAPSDYLLNATLRVTYNTGSIGVSINAVDQTTTLGGPWSGYPMSLNLGAVAAAASTNTLAVNLMNKGSSGSITVQYQLIADILR